MKIKGSGSYTDANGRNHRVLGMGELSDGEHLRSLKVSGNVSFDKISCDDLNVSGKGDGGSISAGELKTSGELSFDDISCDEAVTSGKCAGKSITAKNFSASGKVEVDSLTIAQTLKLSGKPQIDFVTADEIFIGSRDGSIGAVKCRRLKIFHDENFFDRQRSRVRIKSIDAETVELENCTVDVIKCRDAVIGKNCAVEKLFVAGECKVSADSTVGETIRT